MGLLFSSFLPTVFLFGAPVRVSAAVVAARLLQQGSPVGFSSCTAGSEPRNDGGRAMPALPHPVPPQTHCWCRRTGHMPSLCLPRVNPFTQCWCLMGKSPKLGIAAGICLQNRRPKAPLALRLSVARAKLDSLFPAWGTWGRYSVEFKTSLKAYLCGICRMEQKNKMG